MLGHQPYYWEHFKKYAVVVGTLFNDISILRKSATGKETLIKVPISYSQRDKQWEKLRANPELRNSWRTMLPRMGFEMQSPVYDPMRKDNANNLHMLDQDGKQRSMQFPMVPYDIPFSVYVWTLYEEDSFQIIEQILPFFQPSFTVSSKEVPEFGIDRDVHINLIGANFTDTYDGSYEDFRVIEWELNLTVKGHLYGPIIDRKVIKKAMVDYMFDFDANADPVIEYSAEVVPFEADKTDPHEIVETWKEQP